MRRLVHLLVTASLALTVLPALPVAAADEDPTTTVRINDGDPAGAAVDVSGERYADAGASGRQAEFVVLSRDDTFADALAGTALVGRGPLLFTSTDELTDLTAAEIDRVLVDGGRVYLLGGVNAISQAVEDELADAGYDVVRLWGDDRVGTALAIADVVRSLNPTTTVLLVRAFGDPDNPGNAWADSVTGGGYAADTTTPVLLTPTDHLDDDVAVWMQRTGTTRTVLLGGTAALSDAVLNAAPGAERVWGQDRTGTAAAIATRLWGANASGPREFVVSDARQGDSWTFGLAGAGLAADRDAPLLLTMGTVTDATRKLVSTCGEPEVDLTVVGDGSRVSGEVRERLDDLDGLACGPGGTLRKSSNLRPGEACPPLLDWFHETAAERVGPYGLYGFGGPVRAVDESAPEEGATDDTTGGDGAAEPAPEADSVEASDDFSGTNVQELGVDEPDLVKTDGQLAAVVARNDLQLVDVTGDAPRLAATVDLPDEAWEHELLLRGDRLLVLSRTGGYLYAEPQTAGPEGDAAFAPQGTWQPTTILTSVDVSDVGAPVVEGRLEIDGDYRSARMIEGVARVVTVSQPSLAGFVYPADGSREAEHAAAEHNREVVAESVITDWLPAYTRYDAAGDVAAEGFVADCADVRRPPTFSGFDTMAVTTIDLDAGLEPTSSAGVVASGETVYASVDRLLVTTSRWGPWFERIDPTVQTEVHAFDISDPAATTYVASGKVEGYTLNQFSLSEYQGDIRIATTTQPPWDAEEGQVTENRITVLQESGDTLAQVGLLDGLGPDEQIRAVRFMGDLAAVVTFRQIDPLFMIDLSVSENPQVLGELKIPGYSAYLHRLDENHLVGVGQDATEEGRTTGAQVSLFDITDRSDPKRTGHISWENGYSEVEWDHRAFLWWPATTNIVIPLTQWSYDETTGEDTSFTGAVGIDVDVAAGFDSALTEDGRVTHPVETEECYTTEPAPDGEPQPLVDVGGSGSDGSTDGSSGSTAQEECQTYQYDDQIRRSFVVGDTLYTVSEQALAATSLADFSRTGFVQFGG